MNKPLQQTWDLHTFFSGGSESPEYETFLTETEQLISEFQQQISQAGEGTESVKASELEAIVTKLQSITARIHHALSFAECLLAQDQSDKKAGRHLGRLHAMNAAYSSELTRLDAKLTKIPDELWGKMLEAEPFRGIAFPLSERREQALEKLPPEQEALLNDLAVDGYHGWGEAYGTAVSKTKIPFEENGETKLLSVGQAHNKMHSPDREVRQRVFAAWEEAWGNQADYCADALNRLGGFRLQVYKHRKWDSVLKEPLQMNRMTEQTFQTMWDVIEQGKPVFVSYLERKAKLLGLEKLAWYDVEAPIGGQGGHGVSFDEAAEIIVNQFREFSPKLADFAVRTFEERWIEAEDRAGKRPGGFCTGFPLSGQTRIFMTYTGTMDNVSTLAHELGHAFHQHVMDDMPQLAQQYAMNVAETASTFAEHLVFNALIKAAPTKEQKIALLDDKINRSIAYFMNIHARIIFELSFYEERRNGLVSVERLNELMVEAQKKAFHNSLTEYHPHFWASKLHFYATDVPFYNFPYTFGYLFSTGIYAQALKEGQGFDERYIALLRDTGSMTVENLAQKHLGVNLGQPDFWKNGVDLAAQDVAEFLELTK
ncbi:M3 family oligoendopeptidase [Paenibacillus turpanensis]|uniref:M3 family oligoendopeptidase n=1 Tax=Paenibacillus turpanensis TaxID=2689078 RepID=UPI00140E8828|nr:M3 family oligoendopeptidase [Paenibacillus turpanensis]